MSLQKSSFYVPVERFFPWIRLHFFNKANELMVKNSPAAADKEMLEKIAAVNVGPGMEFDVCSYR